MASICLHNKLRIIKEKQKQKQNRSTDNLTHAFYNTIQFWCLSIMI